MQARAIFEAAAEVRQAGSGGARDHDPLVGHVKELALQAEVVRRVARSDAEKGSGSATWSGP